MINVYFSIRAHLHRIPSLGAYNGFALNKLHRIGLCSVKLINQVRVDKIKVCF